MRKHPKKKVSCRSSHKLLVAKLELKNTLLSPFHWLANKPSYNESALHLSYQRPHCEPSQLSVTTKTINPTTEFYHHNIFGRVIIQQAFTGHLVLLPGIIPAKSCQIYKVQVISHNICNNISYYFSTFTVNKHSVSQALTCANHIIYIISYNTVSLGYMYYFYFHFKDQRKWHREIKQLPQVSQTINGEA